MLDVAVQPGVGFARNAARRIIKELKLRQPPVLLRNVIKHIRKGSDIIVTEWNFENETDGIALSIGQTMAIGYNPNKHIHRQRFTVAHEIGHLLLGHTLQKSNPSSEVSNINDLEAHQFAAELLIPLEMLKKDIRLGIVNVKSLAMRYIVSEEAMWRKILDSKLESLLLKSNK